MSILQAKRVPPPLFRELKLFVARHGETVSEFIIAAIAHELARRKFSERMARRPAAARGIAAGRLLDEVRVERA